ncbi:EAL domain-containing protein [Aliivibrio logei]|uniref:bifunctional diguanylate cyclase/phosphodiesterase n=1 Tax=Aliivibrio logei TaxID=688 RepID=UPI0035C8C388
MQLYHSLKTKVWLIILFSFIPASVIIFSNMFYEYRAAKEEVEIDAMQIASSLASEQFSIINEAEEFLVQLSQVDDVKKPNSPQCKHIVQQALKLNTHYVNIAIAGLDGSFDCSALSSASVINVADRSYFRKVITDEIFSISGFQIGRIIKKDTINFAYPVYDSEDVLTGAAVAVISLDWWSERLAEFSLPKNTIAVLVDNNGNILTSNNNVISHYNEEVPLVVKQKMYKKNPFVFEVKNKKGVSFLAASVPLFPNNSKNYSQMIIALPLDDAYQGVMDTLIRSVSLFAISIILFLLILLLGFNRNVIQPIQTLLSSTQKYVEKKRGAKFSGGNELSNLSENFDWVVQEQGFIEKELIDKELRLNRAYTRINNLLDNSTYGVVEWGPNLTIRRWSQSCQNWFGLRSDELLDQDITSRTGIIGDYFSQMTHELEKMREGHSEHAECEIPFVTEDGTVIILIWKLSALYDGNDLIGILALVDDVTKQVEYQQEIEHQAHFDGLTSLPNRYALLNSMNFYLSNQQPFTILHIDIKGFKFINDHYGHLYGDEMLVELSLRINQEVCNGEFFARLGGNEFIYLVSSHDKETLSLRIKELKTIINTPIQIKESNHITHVNLGIATCDSCGKDAEELLRQAGVALHYAKRHSLLDVFYYSSEMENKERMRFNLERDLRNALDRQEFELYYQPILNQRTSMFDSAEALIRWNHPSKGLVSPNEFIPLAEDTGLIHQLGYWVLFESIRQLKEWQDNATGVNKVSVNMSAIQLSDVDVVDKVKHVISYYNVEPSSIVIEVTESALLDSASEVLERIKLIKDLGVLIALDDFGTGYSSLSYLSNLPLNRLKIDRSFVNRIGSIRDEVLINAIISIAHGMNLSVVAEGIETNEHLEFLLGKGCEYGQGYLFSKPLPVTEFEVFIKHHSFQQEAIGIEPKFM